NHDSLTGLPNRDFLHEQAARAVVQAAGNRCHLAFLLMDLNRFKEVNDTLGHSIGDHLLKLLAIRLQKLLEPLGATPYRLGGDEFAVMTGLLSSQQDAYDVAMKVSESLRQPISVEGISLELGASIGISLYPDHGSDSHQMLRCADVAMYYAKTHGTGIAFYENAQDSNSPRRLTMMAELGTAIRENQLVLHYQPRIDLDSGLCTGCEALLRWQHPKHGMIPPGDFIPAAEMSDIIHPLSQWVLRNALEQVQRWQQAGLSLAVAVNLSARNLADRQCPDKIAQLLQAYAVPPHLLEIEITESALINDPDRAMQVVDRIHQLGIPLAIDDFGTGYSSLSYLKRLPIDTLKIDRSFVKDMRENEADAVIVRSTIALAHSFGLKVVAEGVEDIATLDSLRLLSCDQAQGFGIARPLPLAAFMDWLNQQTRH
ncbi:MAG TPA: EAL domain-containing protein, partial [Dongiaceae bacterium]|nr:EAL domain-containing protein [Dongiaceae bacterium]